MCLGLTGAHKSIQQAAHSDAEGEDFGRKREGPAHRSTDRGRFGAAIERCLGKQGCQVDQTQI